jgi:putative two-component system response regulator
MSEFLIADKADVLVVDDQVENLQLLVALLSPDYNVRPFSDGESALRYVESGRPADLVLLDVMMPGRDGYEICAAIRSLPFLQELPVVFLTGMSTPEDEQKGFDAGGVDYITKPFSPQLVLARVRHHVRLGRALRLIISQNELLDRRVEERTAELAKTRDAAIVAFSSIACERDNETGQHIRRTQHYVREMALALRRNPKYAPDLDDESIDLIFKSAPLHDIGKVAIPDSILLKPGKLDVAEFEVMKTHTTHGRTAIESAEESLGSPSSFLRYAKEIAYCHHEKWDGSGYPRGLAGDDIPLAGRLMAVADVYDALISKRVYKAGMTHEQAMGIILQGSGKHFDPEMISVLISIQYRFVEIAERYKDVQEEPRPLGQAN